MEEENLPASEAWMYLTDILRLTVTCNSVEEVQPFMGMLLQQNGYRMEVLRFKPRFNKFLKDMIINFVWNERVVCEMQIKLGETPPGLDD